MTKHDTWATVADDSKLKELMRLFDEEQLPLRDPFPFLLCPFGKLTADLYVIDCKRLTPAQCSELREKYKFHLNISDKELTDYIQLNGGLTIHQNSVCQKFYGAESYNRMIEFLDFVEENPEPNLKTYKAFCDDQYSRWVIGDEEPMPLPQTFAEYDPRFRTPELEKALKEQQIEQQMANYSAFDILTGKATVDILNQIDPDNHYELVGLEEMLEDE